MITIGNENLRLNDFYAIIFDDDSVELSEEVLKKVNDSFVFLQDFAKEKVIYGVNTGFGPMAQYLINREDQQALQYNLIRSHASGGGTIIPSIYGKAVVLARLCNLRQGYSGIHTDVIKLLADCINKGISPCIYEHGGVGASGDLVQLAHLAYNLIGEGEVWYKEECVSTETAFEAAHIKPLQIRMREGLALINGTSAMTGVGMVNLVLAQRLVAWSTLASCMINEIISSFDDHFSTELNNVKQHKGQHQIAAHMRELLKDSQLTRKRFDYMKEEQIDLFKQENRVQEYYSVRCVPQILGPILDTLAGVETILEQEINSVSDNPIVDVENQNVFHGGNFHGDYVSFEMDKLKIAITKLTILAERQLNYLLNDQLNNKLPPFVNLGKLGLNFGMQGVQFTATSTTAENQSLSFPMYVHSIPNNKDNQDVVSMGFNAAWMAKKVIDNAYEVVAIEMMCILQAIGHLKIADLLASSSRKCYFELSAIFPIFDADFAKYKDIKSIKEYLLNTDIALFSSSDKKWQEGKKYNV